MGENSLNFEALLGVVHGRLEWGATPPQAHVSGVFSDSRKVVPASVFVATKGTTTDGHDYLSKAIELGASVVVVESRDKIPSHYNGAVLQVLDSKWVLADLLSRYYAHPEDKMISIGITGTNGKTSTSYIIETLLNHAGVACGVMGTINHHFKHKMWPTGLTTPDAQTFFARANEFLNLGARAFAMEVSSHSLHQKRVPIHFDVAVFTNFTRDHLDYHKTMDEYFRAKELLFTEHFKKTGDVFAIVNTDDPVLKNLRIAKNATRISFGKKDADLRIEIQTMGLEGTTFTLTEDGETHTYESPLIGEHNVYNVAGAVGVARALGVSHAGCQAAIRTFGGVPGRLQKIISPSNNHPYVFVDYAHTPDALEKTIETLRAVCGSEQEITTVFGCGGDRDPGKRPTMGKIAAAYSDRVVITSDNPRSEDPYAIMQQIVEGIPGVQRKNVLQEVDRKKAIIEAITSAAPGDAVLIAGKGHENYQILKDKTIDFDDAKVALEVMR